LSNLIFDQEKHEYRVGDSVLPSVTQIIHGVFGSRPWWNENSAKIGTALHRACELESKGMLDHTSIDPLIQGRFQGFVRFRELSDFIITGNEKRLYSDKYWFAGTIDIIAEHNGNKAILDIKSSLDPSAFIQIGAYSIMEPCREAYVLELMPSGKYKLHSLKNKTTWKSSLKYWQNAFLHVYSVYGLMERHSL